MKQATQQLTLDIRTDEGRCQVSVDLTFLTKPERIFLFGILQAADKGGNIGFGIGNGEDESTKVISFILSNPLAPNLSQIVRRELN